MATNSTHVYDLDSYKNQKGNTKNTVTEIYTKEEYDQMQKMLKEGREYSEMLRKADETRKRIDKIRAKREHRKNIFADILVYLLVVVFNTAGLMVVNYFVDKPSVPDNKYWSYILIAIMIFGMISMMIFGYISERIHLNEKHKR